MSAAFEIAACPAVVPHDVGLDISLGSSVDHDIVDLVLLDCNCLQPVREVVLGCLRGL